MLIATVAVACAVLIGLVAHRASLCNVRAVAEIMTSGSAHMLWSLPAMTVTALLTYLSMLAGIALVLGAPRAARIPMPAISCSPSGCDDPGIPANGSPAGGNPRVP